MSLFNSIRSRLFFFLSVPLVVIAVAVSFETFFTARKISNQLHDKTLLAAMLTISENVVSSNGTILAEKTLKVLTDNLGDEFFYYVIGPDGAFVTGYSGYPKPPDDDDFAEGVPLFYDGFYQGSMVRVTAIKQVLEGRDLNGVTTIITWQETTQRRALTLQIFSRSLLRLLVLVVAVAVIVWFAVAFGLRPLKKLQDAIEARTPYDLTPIRRVMPIELSGIVRSMNDLLRRVARSKANRERFIGDAAHQLRNPIAALKIQAETALSTLGKEGQRQSLEQIVKVSNQTSELIDKMLTNASAHAVERDRREDFDLRPLMEEAARMVVLKALEKNQDFDIDFCDQPVRINGHRVLLREAMINLLDNAVKYAPEKSRILFQLTQDSTYLYIAIHDEGAVMSEEQFLKHSQPFFTGNHAVPNGELATNEPIINVSATNGLNNSGVGGSGLGLAIAKEVAKSHGGYLTIKPRDGGKAIIMVVSKTDIKISKL